MHIKKQRLLTPGPTPLYPKALHAMLGADMHHRTEDFRDVYPSVLADLKEVMGTSNDVLVLVSSGTGAMEASVTNCFSPGDRVIVCSAGKFGERWAEIDQGFRAERARARRAVRESGAAGSASKRRWRRIPIVKGVFVQASETSTGAAHDVRADGPGGEENRRDFRGRCDYRSRHHAARYRRWGLDIVIGGSQKAFMVPPGLAFLSISPKAWAMMETAKLPRYYFNLKKERKIRGERRIRWTAATALMLALAEALKYIKTHRHGEAGG